MGSLIGGPAVLGVGETVSVGDKGTGFSVGEIFSVFGAVIDSAVFGEGVDLKEGGGAVSVLGEEAGWRSGDVGWLVREGVDDSRTEEEGSGAAPVGIGGASFEGIV